MARKKKEIAEETQHNFLGDPVLLEETIEKEKKITPFDIISDQTHTKLGLYASDPDKYDKVYSQVIINKFYSLFRDTILHANNMNILTLPNSFHDNYYHNAIIKKKRYKSWPKKMKAAEKQELLKKFFPNSSKRDIEDYVSIMSEEDINEIKRIINGDNKG